VSVPKTVKFQTGFGISPLSWEKYKNRTFLFPGNKILSRDRLKSGYANELHLSRSGIPPERRPPPFRFGAASKAYAAPLLSPRCLVAPKSDEGGSAAKAGVMAMRT
jgi:hypothetical protein